MDSLAFSELFPLFNNAQPQTLEWILSITRECTYPPGKIVLTEELWGTAVYFIVSGWVKMERIDEQKAIAIEIIGRGDFYGESAILDEYPRSTSVITLSELNLIVIPAQRFIQILLQDSQLQHRMLQLTLERVRHLKNRLFLNHQSNAVKITETLIFLAEQYGEHTEKGKEIYNLAYQDLADLSSTTPEESQKIVEKLENKGWIEIDRENATLCITNLKQILHLAKHLSA
ncbi:MAG: Crp/Fnr family transcriptional regulator [Prochloraceae cyanobacterium]|nr:Crp/Fnr family transcriptional regulator [Prochloraceae cyanobacterium]